MNKEEIIKYFYWLKVKNLALCDGVTENYSMGFNILYPLFIVSGITLFIIIYMKWCGLLELLKK